MTYMQTQTNCQLLNAYVTLHMQRKHWEIPIIEEVMKLRKQTQKWLMHRVCI